MSIKDGCSTENLLVRDGTSQEQRMLKALAPDYVKVDERDYLDLINFARDYADDVQFFETTNVASGDWTAFYNNDISSLIALISSVNLKQLIDDKNTIVSILQDTSATNKDMKEGLQLAFDLLFTLAYDVNQWYKKAVDDLLLQRELKRLIKSNLSNVLQKLIGAYKEASESPELVDDSSVDHSLLNYTMITTSRVLDYSFEDVWIRYDEDGQLAEDWDTYVGNIGADKHIFGPNRTKVRKSISFSTDTMEAFIEQFIAAIRQITIQAPVLIQDTLENYNKHDAHMALFLSFIQVFKYSQDHINTITKRHLDFYYKEVLQLETKPMVSDKVHLIVELAKHVSEHKLDADTLLKAGKDDSGIAVQYGTSEDFVANKTSVDSLKSLFVDQSHNHLVFSASQANSKDGQGGEFEEDHPKWKAFGESQVGVLDDERTMTDATIGFAISTNNLVLKEGKRLITLVLTTDKEFKNTHLAKLEDTFKYALTTEKGWHEGTFEQALTKSEYAALLGTGSEITSDMIIIDGKKLIFSIYLSLDDEAILPYDKDVHEGAFASTDPILKILCTGDESNYAYGFLRDTTVSHVWLKTYVQELKHVVLQSDAGLIDPSKPFQPFGPRPLPGSNFIIGSQEVFSKDLIRLVLHGHWVDLPAAGFTSHYSHYNATSEPTNASFKTSVKGLQNGNWSQDLKQNATLFSGTDPSPSAAFEMTVFGEQAVQMENNQVEEELSNYAIDTRNGFIKLELTDPAMAFGHAMFPTLYAAKSMEQVAAGASFDITKLPNPPYTPTLKDFSLSYMAITDINLGDSSKESFDENQGTYFHLTPFGHKVKHPSLENDALTTMLPRFSHTDKDSLVIEHQGEFYIGLKDLETPQDVSLLIRVAEGSENPERNKQEIDWFYLAGNEWVAFETQDILADTSNGLLKEGILKFSMPRAMDDKHTVMPTDTFWIKGSVDKNSDAICDVQTVQAQAMQAEFMDNNNDDDYLLNALPAESISKLVNREASVKSITQPYASFDGKTAEKSNDFYRRVSERLRHKQRSLTIWDYERMVLEEFPKIYKAKCINHSTYAYEKPNGDILNSEFAPGFVTMIVIPDLINDNAADPFKPKASKALLDDISTYLKSKMPEWASRKLQVLNPLYEEIQVILEVEFSTSDRGYYEKKLNEDIKQFLSPWAYEEGKDLIFGGKLHSSVILNYIEELDYVDYIKHFNMCQYVNGTLLESNIEEAFPTSARSIFATISNNDITKEHVIKEISK